MVLEHVNLRFPYFLRIAAAAMSFCLLACGAADRVSEASDAVVQAEQRLEERRMCFQTNGACPTIGEAYELAKQAIDDCYELVTIDTGPDQSCCFGVTVELSVDAATECL